MFFCVVLIFLNLNKVYIGCQMFLINVRNFNTDKLSKFIEMIRVTIKKIKIQKYYKKNEKMYELLNFFLIVYIILYIV